MKADFTEDALADLEEIEAFIARDNPRAAAAWVGKLVARADKAASQPLAGRIVPELEDPEIREVLLRTYRIIYRVEKARIVVLTVIEGHRRLRRIPRR